MFEEILLVLAVGIAMILLPWCRMRRKYWERRGVVAVDCPQAHESESEAVWQMKIYDKYRAEPFVGMMQGTAPALLLVSPAVINRLCTQDYRDFLDRGLPKNKWASPLSAKHLFTLDGDQWKYIREVMSPAFSITKVKAMHERMFECGKNLTHVLRDVAAQQESINMQDILERFTTDVIGRCCFSVNSSSLLNERDDFYDQCMKAFELSAWRKLREYLIKWVPHLAVLVPYRNAGAKFFQSAVQSLEMTRASPPAPAQADFLDIMFKEKRRVEQKDELDRIIVAQMFATFRAGFETTAPVLAFCLLELAHHPEIQQQLQAELDEVFAYHGHKYTHESLKAMKYTDRVLKETLRKYPPNALLARKCTRDHMMTESQLQMEKGVKIIIPVYALHHDPAYYPDPERFDPDRWLSPQKEARPYLPFGSGQRKCLAQNFGLAQIKVGLVAILTDFSVRQSSETVFPVRFQPGRRFVLASKDACHLHVEPRRGTASSSARLKQAGLTLSLDNLFGVPSRGLRE